MELKDARTMMDTTDAGLLMAQLLDEYGDISDWDHITLGLELAADLYQRGIKFSQPRSSRP